MRVRGSMLNLMPLEVNLDTVFIRTNISHIETTEFVGWEYDEEQIPVTAFIADLQQENESLKKEQIQTNTTLLDLMEVVLIGGM